jgi:hypothetical protein
MKRQILFVLCLGLVSGRSLFADSFIAGDLAVLQVGDGNFPLSSAASALFIDEFTTAGTAVQQIALPNDKAIGLSLSGTASSEGALTLSSDHTALTFAGYVSEAGIIGISSSKANTNRAVGVLSSAGTFTRVATGSSLAFNQNNVRSAVSDGQNYWMAGASSGSGNPNGGVWFSASGGVPSQVQAGNFRNLNIVNGSLYFSTGAGTPGIYKYSALPNGTAASSLVFGIPSGSPYDFAFSPDGNTAYVADDGAGLEKWQFNGTLWSEAYTLVLTNSGVRQIAVDFSGANAVIYATTTGVSANQIVTITDTGAGSQYTVLATASANTVFRGIDFTPTVPEPSAAAIVALGSLALAARRRKARK